MAPLILTFHGAEVRFTDDGWFNATQVAARYGKRTAEWLRLPETRKYLAALRRKSDVGFSHFTRTVKGNSSKFEQGTWLHPKLAVRFAQWLDVDFAVWCDEQIDHILHGRSSQLARAAGAFWSQRLQLETEDGQSFALASVGSRWMGARRRALPRLRAERARLQTEMEPSLFIDAQGGEV